MIPKKVIRIIFFNIVRCRLYTIGPSVLVALIPVGAVVGVRLFYMETYIKRSAGICIITYPAILGLRIALGTE